METTDNANTDVRAELEGRGKEREGGTRRDKHREEEGSLVQFPVSHYPSHLLHMTG